MFFLVFFQKQNNVFEFDGTRKLCFLLFFCVFKYLCTVKYNAFGESQSKQHVFSVSVTSVSLPSHSRLTPVIFRLTPVSLPSSPVSLPSHSRLAPVIFRLTPVSLPSSSVSLPSHFRGKGKKTTERETEVRRKRDGSEKGVRRKVTGVRRE